MAFQGDDSVGSPPPPPPNGVWKDESTYLKVESGHQAALEPRAFSPNTLRRKGENMAKALARIMITKVVDRRRKSDIEREAAQKVRWKHDNNDTKEGKIPGL